MSPKSVSRSPWNPIETGMGRPGRPKVSIVLNPVAPTNKWPPITLATLKAMTDLDREVIIHACKKFRSWIEAVLEDTGVFIK